jgi:rubrerythrin
MHASRFLKDLSRLEQLVGDLYQWYAEIFSDLDAVRDLFSSMHRQELQHKNIIEMELRLIANCDIELRDVAVDVAQIGKLAERIEEQIGQGVFEVKDALDFAIDVERSAVETHFKSVVAESNPQIAKLMKALSAEDTIHVQKLVAFRDSLR